MKHKIDICDQNHPGCKSLNPRLPTRVLNVCAGEDHNGTTLEETTEAHGKYAALSHCWGRETPATTTIANLDDRKVDISIADLPLTFQEAIWLTRQLDLQYLWIDSLCIIQDDSNDWRREAPRMANVYGDAFITFSASHSTGCHTGLFPPDIFSRTYRTQTPEAKAMGFSTEGDNIPYSGGARHVYSTGQPFAWDKDYEYNGQKSDIFLTSEWLPPSFADDDFKFTIGDLGKSFDPLSSDPEHLSTRAWT